MGLVAEIAVHGRAAVGRRRGRDIVTSVIIAIAGVDRRVTSSRVGADYERGLRRVEPGRAVLHFAAKVPSHVRLISRRVVSAVVLFGARRYVGESRRLVISNLKTTETM